MSKNTATASAAAVKKVTKKGDAPAAVSPAVSAKAEAAAVPIADAKKGAAAASKKAASSSKSEIAAPVVEAAPKAAEPAVAADAVEEKSVDEQIKELIEANQKARELATAHIKVLQRIQKKVAKDLKEAGRKRRRVKKEDDGTPKEKRPTIFTTPVTLKDELCVFLGKPKGSQMTPAEVTRAISKYVEDHKLKDATKGHTIHPDAALRKALSIKDGEETSYRSLQKILYSRCYILPVKASA